MAHLGDKGRVTASSGERNCERSMRSAEEGRPDLGGSYGSKQVKSGGAASPGGGDFAPLREPDRERRDEQRATAA